MPAVYIIQNIIDGSIYIGKANDINKRWSQHKNNHLKGKFASSYLYRAFNKYGFDNFTFQVLEYFETSKEALEAEKWYVGYLRWLGAQMYNLTPGGDGGRPKGIPCTNETKRLISLKNKGKSKNKKQNATKNLDFDNDFSYFEEE